MPTSKTAAAPAIRAYLGGSFDPVHHGHIQMAMHVYNCLASLAEQQQRPLHVSLLPNARSPFKQNSTAAAHRLAMLQLAIEDTPLQISELELWQTPPVYTIDSVRALRQLYPNDSLIFIMGMDSARSLEKWKDGLQLTDYVHLWIFNRSDNADNPQQILSTHNSNNPQKLSAQDTATLRVELPTQLQAQVTDQLINLSQPVTPLLKATFKASQALKSRPLLKSFGQGRIYIDPRQVTAISSTQIRQYLRERALKPPQTDKFTTNNKINPLTKCLNPTVNQYIIAHQLYSAAQFR